MGSLDSHNIYIYDETDNVTPLHTFMNLGQATIGPAIDAVLNKWLEDYDAPFRMAIAQVAFENTATHPHTNVSVTYPPNRFTRAPMVWAQPISPRGGQFRVTARPHSFTTTGCQINVGTIISGSGQSFPISGHVNVLAIQMLPTQAFG